MLLHSNDVKCIYLWDLTVELSPSFIKDCSHDCTYKFLYLTGFRMCFFERLILKQNRSPFPSCHSEKMISAWDKCLPSQHSCFALSFTTWGMWHRQRKGKAESRSVSAQANKRKSWEQISQWMPLSLLCPQQLDDIISTSHFLKEKSKLTTLCVYRYTHTHTYTHM